jgi:hypothetical protein
MFNFREKVRFKNNFLNVVRYFLHWFTSPSLIHSKYFNGSCQSRFDHVLMFLNKKIQESNVKKS